MIEKPSLGITDDMSEEERIYIETRSKRQPEYTAPGYDDPKIIDGVLLRDKDSLIYSYVTEYQIDTSDIDNLSL